MDKLVSEIADDEKVARILFSPSHIYKGRVSPKAFKLEKLKGDFAYKKYAITKNMLL